MAVITISRQYGSKGDEICKNLSEKLGYKLVDRAVLRKRILALGCSEDKMRKFDGLKPNFFATFSKSKDEYLYYLKTAMIQEITSGNCVVVGRGSFLLLKDIKNCISFRIIEERKLRVERLMKKLDIDEKEAMKIIKKADWHQFGFHKSFFGAKVHDFFLYDFLINSGNSDVEAISSAIYEFTKSKITPELERIGNEQIDRLALGQTIVNMLIFTYKVDINDLRVTIEDDLITLYGVTSFAASVEYALKILNLELTGFRFKSEIRVVQDTMK